MVSEDRPKLPRATVRDGKLYVEGEKELYFQDRFRLPSGCAIHALTVYRGYEPANYKERAGNKALTGSLHGTARLEDGNRFALIGLETDRKTPIQFSPADNFRQPETQDHWGASIGFTPHDWEFPDCGEEQLLDPGVLHETISR